MPKSVISVHCAFALGTIMTVAFAPKFHGRMHARCTEHCCMLIFTEARNVHVVYFMIFSAPVLAPVQCIMRSRDISSRDYDGVTDYSRSTPCSSMVQKNCSELR